MQSRANREHGSQDCDGSSMHFDFDKTQTCTSLHTTRIMLRNKCIKFVLDKIDHRVQISNRAYDASIIAKLKR